MKFVSRARKIGGSIFVSIPKEVVKEEGVISGVLLDVEFKKHKKSYFGIAKGLGSLTDDDRWDIE